MVDGALTGVLLVAVIVRWLLTSDYGMDQPRIRGVRDQRLGGPGQAAMFDEALESGIVPARADRMAWLRELKGEREQSSLRLRALELIITACIVGQLVDNVWGGTVEDLIRFAWFAAAAAAIFGAWLLTVRIRGDKESDRRSQLLSTLESQTAAYRVVDELRSRQPLARIARRVRTSPRSPSD